MIVNYLLTDKHIVVSEQDYHVSFGVVICFFDNQVLAEKARNKLSLMQAGDAEKYKEFLATKLQDRGDFFTEE